MNWLKLHLIKNIINKKKKKKSVYPVALYHISNIKKK